MKKTFWLALILLLICVIAFSGCDNNGDTSPDTGDSNQTTESGGNDNSSAVCVHSYGEWATIKQATCKGEGKQVRSCSKCSETEESTVPKSNIHTEVLDAAVPATCTTDGKTEGKHCSVCNKTLVVQTAIKAPGHTEVIDPAVNATCKTEGKTEGKHCSECSTILIAQESVSKLNHNYENYICTACDDEYYTPTLVFVLSEDNASYIVSGITDNTETTVVIPSKYNSKPVSAIGYEAFNESNIKSVVFGSNIKLIDAWAFRACTQLTTIVLPDNLTQIGEGAFAGCVGLSSVVMKDNVETIGKMAFYQCGNLSSINLSKKLTSIGVGAFADNVKLETIVFPDTLITIGEQAFVGCIKIKSITIPNKVETIDNYAFAQCAALEEINIGTSNLKIGSRSFMECEALVNLYIPGTVEYIDIQAFAYCTSLTEVVVINGVKSINSAAFQGCTKIEYMELPFIGHTSTNDQYIGWIFGIVSWYKDNASVVPSSLKSIGYTGGSLPSNAFYGCESIEIFYYCPEGTHSVTKDAYQAPTCQQTGLTEGSHCSKCNKVLVEQNVIDKEPHNYVNNICSYCKNSKEKQAELDIESARHNESVSNYNTLIQQYTESIANAKKLYGIDTVPEESGYYRYLIQECDTLIDNLKNSIAHYQMQEQMYGYDRSAQIAECENKIELQKQKKANYNKYLTIAEYEETLLSYQQQLQEENAQHTENIRLIEAKHYCIAHGHTNVVIDPAKVTTCGGEGLSEGSHCADCKVVIIEQTVTPPPGHSFSNGNNCSVCGSPKPSDGLRYTLRSDGKSYALSGMGSCTDTKVIIADLYNGLPVVEIAAEAFYKNTRITSVVVPENVRVIGTSAFFRCENLVSITLPSTLEEVKYFAFYNCEKLTGIYISDISKWCSVNFIDQGSNNPLDYAGNLYLNGELVTDLVIPSDVTVIAPSVFGDCTSITSVTIPATVKTIGSSAFSMCTNLKEVKIENGVTTIDKYAFYACWNLETVVIGNTVATIGEWAFEYCNKLTTIYFEGTKAAWNKISVGSNNSQLTNATCYYYSSTNPNETNAYWHYVNGIPTIWN